MAQQLLTHPFNLQQRRPHAIQILPAFVGQRQSAATAPEQFLTEISFQLLDLVTDRTLTDRQLLRRQRKAVQPGNGFEDG